MYYKKPKTQHIYDYQSKNIINLDTMVNFGEEQC